jgi:hypothetical protein
VELPQVEAVGVEQAQTLLEEAQRSVAGAVVRLAGQEHLPPARLHHLADVALADGGRGVAGRPAAAVGGGRVDVVDPEVDGPVDDGDRLVAGPWLLERRLAAEAEDPHHVAGAPERALGHGRCRRAGTADDQGRRASRPDLDELPSRQLVAAHRTPPAGASRFYPVRAPGAAADPPRPAPPRCSIRSSPASRRGVQGPEPAPGAIASCSHRPRWSGSTARALPG